MGKLPPPLYAHYRIESKLDYFDTGFFVPLFFCRQVSVKIVLFIIQLENNQIYLSFRIISSFWQCNQMDKTISRVIAAGLPWEWENIRPSGNSYEKSGISMAGPVLLVQVVLTGLLR